MTWAEMVSAPGTDSGLSLIPCLYFQEAVPRERLIPWWESQGSLIFHLQVRIPFGKGAAEDRIRDQCSHPASDSVSPPVCPQRPPHPVLEPGTLLPAVLRPLQGPRAPAPRYQDYVYMWDGGHPGLCVCVCVCVCTGFGG